MRHFVLVEPFRKCDVSIFPDTLQGIQAADALCLRFQREGKRIAFVTQSGSLNDLKSTLDNLRQAGKEAP